MRPFFFFWMPFSLANLSHFVSAFFSGQGFSRGSAVVAGGSFAMGPTELRVAGSSKSDPMSACVALAARAVRSAGSS